MLWFLVLHIIALVLWAAALLYMPALLAARGAHHLPVEAPVNPHDSIERFVFTRIATPAALTAIMAGTLVFVIDRTVDAWLIVKLTLVAALVLCHIAVGGLVLRVERGGSPLVPVCIALAVTSVLLFGLILWIVLAKPVVGASL
ncbi:MAG: CopD family protein [Pseudomonas sp.]